MAQATLIDGQGKKVVVDVGSQQAQQYFGQGYKLMGAPTTSPPTGPTSPVDTSSTQMSDTDRIQAIYDKYRGMAGLDVKEKALSDYRKKITETEDLLDKLEGDISTRSTAFQGGGEQGGVSEAYRRRLLATEGAPLRTQLAGLAKGESSLVSDVNAARQQFSDLLSLGEKYDTRSYEEKQKTLDYQRDLAKEGYIKIASPAQLAGLSEKDIMRVPGTNEIWKKPPEKKTATGGSGGGSGVTSKFTTAVNKEISNLQKGESWGTVWNRLKLQFPKVPDETIDTALGKSWREPGAYEKFKAAKGTSGQTNAQREAGAWQWLASQEAINMSNEQKKQELMSNGFNPEDFGIY